MSYLGNTPTTQSFISGTDYFNGDGSTTAFTLTRTVNSVNDIEAVVNNVVQQPNSAYTLSGTTITFTSAPSSGTNNIYVRYLSTTTQSITPSQNTVSYSTMNTDMQGLFGQSFTNRIINGAMMIDQRNAGASVTPASTNYTLDRWIYTSSQSGKVTVQQNAGSVTPPAGFKNYLGVTSTSAYSITSSDYFNISQKIEGYNIADLGFGASGASTVTLSFWVRSSLTGTFGANIGNSGDSRLYPFSYTINAANTWEQKTVTITGDTSGTWLATNGVGLIVFFGLGVGSNYVGTANSWNGTSGYVPAGSTSVVGTNGATWYVTGVQLEKGSTATSFDYRPYTTEYQLCQRYFIKNTNFNVYGSGSMLTTTAAKIYFGPAQMRASPTSAYGSTGNQFRIYGGSAAYAVSSIDENNSTSDSLCSTYIISSALTVGWGVVGIGPASSPSSWYVSFSAEL